MIPFYLGAAASVAPPPAGPPDPHWASVVLLLNGDSLQDATGRHAVEVTGAPVASGGWINLDGSSALRITDALGDFSFAEPHTIEGEIEASTAANLATWIILSNYNGGGSWQFFGRGPGNAYRGGIYGEGAFYFEPNEPAWATDAPVAFAWTWDGLTGRLFLNGAVIASGANGGADFVQNTLGPLHIGCESPGGGGGKFLTGKLRLRITNGIARYTGNYTPEPWPRPTRGPA